MDVKAAAQEILDLLPKDLTGDKDEHCRTKNHAKWMLISIIHSNMPPDKINRWLGYAQGLLVCHKLITMSQCASINRRAIYVQ